VNEGATAKDDSSRRAPRADGPAVTTILIAIIFLCVPLTVGFVAKARSGEVMAGDMTCERRPIAPGDTLEGASMRAFGEPSYGWGILLATNMQPDLAPGAFIDNPRELPVGKSLCVPDEATARKLQQRYDSYSNAMRVAMLSEPPTPSHPLLSLEPGQEVTLVTWMRAGSASALKAAAPPKLKREAWVTLASRLKEFCQAYVRQSGPDAAALALRLEQRLGLPPGAGYTQLVEFKLTVPKTFSPNIIFRPCADPRTDSAACATRLPPRIGPFDEVGPALAIDSEEFRHWYWGLAKYYGSYGVQSPYQYPWTAAGYTFDWAPRGADCELFEKWGESQFVVTPAAAIHDVSVENTAKYCGLE
jgi:hypothetical protein